MGSTVIGEVMGARLSEKVMGARLLEKVMGARLWEHGYGEHGYGEQGYWGSYGKSYRKHILNPGQTVAPN